MMSGIVGMQTFGYITIGAIGVSVFVGAVIFMSLLPGNERHAEPRYTVTHAVAPAAVSAAAWLVFDARQGMVLAAHEPDMVRAIASVAKLFAASTFGGRNDLTATTSIVWTDLATEGEAGRLRFGEVYTVRELLFPLLLESSNDAATVLERVDPQLVESLNQATGRLQLFKTSFVDGSGLSPENKSTARELALLTSVVYTQAPYIFDATRVSSYHTAFKSWRNNSPVLFEPGYRGGKHGWTPEAGRTFVGVFDEMLFGGTVREIGYVILGSDDIATDVRALRAEVSALIRYQ